jgi:hypothetical protein
MTDPENAEEQTWPRHCDVCGTALASAVVDFDEAKADRPEMRPGEMAAVDYCPNPDCPSHASAGPEGGPVTGPGSLGGDNGGG